MHHKRGKRKNVRAGGVTGIKTWKANGVNKWAKRQGRHADLKKLVGLQKGCEYCE